MHSILYGTDGDSTGLLPRRSTSGVQAFSTHNPGVVLNQRENSLNCKIHKEGTKPFQE